MPLCVDRMAAAKQLYSEGTGNRLCTKLEAGYGRKRGVRNGSKGFDLQDWKKESLFAEKKKRLWEMLIWVGEKGVIRSQLWDRLTLRCWLDTRNEVGDPCLTLKERSSLETETWRSSEADDPFKATRRGAMSLGVQIREEPQRWSLGTPNR